jgi:phosphoribosylformylglycinamidine (FGAM) synthase-like enzyme
MGHNLPEGAQRFKFKAVSGGGSDIFLGRATMFDGIGGAVYSAESKRRE